MRLQCLRVTLERGAVDKQHDAGDREQQARDEHGRREARGASARSRKCCGPRMYSLGLRANGGRACRDISASSSSRAAQDAREVPLHHHLERLRVRPCFQRVSNV